MQHYPSTGEEEEEEGFVKIRADFHVKICWVTRNEVSRVTHFGTREKYTPELCWFHPFLRSFQLLQINHPYMEVYH